MVMPHYTNTPKRKRIITNVQIYNLKHHTACHNRWGKKMTPAVRGIRPTLRSQNPTQIHSTFFLPPLTYPFLLKSNDGFFSECVCVMPNIHIWPESSDCLGIISTDFSSSPTLDWDQPTSTFLPILLHLLISSLPTLSASPLRLKLLIGIEGDVGGKKSLQKRPSHFNKSPPAI